MVTLLYIPGIFGLSLDAYLILLATGIITFYVWKSFFRKYIAAGNTKTMAAWLATLFASPIVYLGLIILFLFVLPNESSKYFDQLEWQNDLHTRYKMADDIIGSEMLIGKDATAVKQLLGEPTWNDKPSQQWTYDMGMGKGGLGFMFHNLVVKFDHQKVISVTYEKIQD